MKISCSCSNLIIDGTDALPDKGHVIPDRVWFDVFDALDSVITGVADGTVGLNTARSQARAAISRRSRLAYQCGSCGRIHLENGDRTLSTFSPDGPPGTNSSHAAFGA